MTDPATLLGFGIGIAGIIASFVFYVRSKERPKPVWRAANLPLIGGGTPLLPADVEVIYRGAEVESLAKTYIVFWNAGRKTINGSDVVALDPIRFTVKDPHAKVLSARIIRRTREVDQANVQFDEGEIGLKFDFLDTGDGVTLEVIHTGVDKQIGCFGTIRGIPRGISQAGRPTRFSTGSSSRKRNDAIPVDFRKVAVGWRIAEIAAVAGLVLFIAAIFGVLGIIMLNYHPVHTSAPLSYAEYLKQYHQYLRDHHRLIYSNGTQLRFLGIMLLVFAGLALLAGAIIVIRSSRFRIPRKLTLTPEDTSDR